MHNTTRKVAARGTDHLNPTNLLSQARVRDCTDIPSSLLVQIRARDAICDAIRDSG